MALGTSTASIGAADANLSVEAGLGGLTKPGRWTPVRIVTRADTAIDGELVVEWGATSLERPIQIAPGATQAIEVYLQTMQVGAAVSARLVSGGREVASATAPIRTLRADEPFVLCVGAAAADDCAGTQPAATLPRSLPGYDALDRIVWPGSDDSMLRAEQREALNRWRSLRALDETGSLAATDRPRSVLPALARKSRTGPHVQVGFAVYLLMLIGTGLWLASKRAGPAVALGALGTLLAAGSVAALSAGRAGPGSEIVIHHATLIQQLAGANGSILTMQGAAEYPTFDAFVVHALLDDAAFETAVTKGEKAVREFDANGYPVIGGTFGLGDRQSFTLYGVSDYQPLAVVRRGEAIEVTNTSREDLTDCQFGDGTVAAEAGVLRGGASATVRLAEPIIGPVITCSPSSPPVSFTENRRDVRTTGRTIVAAYLSPLEGQGQ